MKQNEIFESFNWFMLAFAFFIVILLTSCKKETPQNCACNKITHSSIQFVGVGESYSGEIYTQNECSGYIDTIQVSGTGHNAPKQGDCF